jgi:hypothetical protein
VGRRLIPNIRIVSGGGKIGYRRNVGRGLNCRIPHYQGWRDRPGGFLRGWSLLVTISMSGLKIVTKENTLLWMYLLGTADTRNLNPSLHVGPFRIL